MSVIPYIAGVTQHDWDFWEGFLREHREINIIAKEFQTGPSNNQVALWHIGVRLPANLDSQGLRV